MQLKPVKDAKAEVYFDLSGTSLLVVRTADEHIEPKCVEDAQHLADLARLLAVLEGTLHFFTFTRFRQPMLLRPA